MKIPKHLIDSVEEIPNFNEQQKGERFKIFTPKKASKIRNSNWTCT